MKWLGAVRQRAIIWANVDLDPCRHKTSLAHNESYSDDRQVTRPISPYLDQELTNHAV